MLTFKAMKGKYLSQEDKEQKRRVKQLREGEAIDELDEDQAREVKLKAIMRRAFGLNEVAGMKVIDPYEEPRRAARYAAGFFAWLDGRLGVIHPMSPMKLRWDMMTVWVLLACLVITPFQLCFLRQDVGLWEPLEILNLSLDALFLADLLLNFNTGYFDKDGTLVEDRRRIAYAYVRSWCLVDFVSSVPINHLLSGLRSSFTLGAAARLTKLMKMLKFSRMLKMFKLLKLVDSINQWDDDPTQAVIADVKHFGKMLLMVVFMAHFSACAFALLAGGDEDGWGARTWVARFFNDGRPLRHDEGGSARYAFRPFPTPARLYVVAMYWAFTTLTTVGYGDITPVSNAEMVLTVVVQFAGTCVLGYVMGDVAALLTREEASTTLIKERIESINAYMKHRNLPLDLKMQIRSHFSYSWERNSVWDEREILCELPPFLRSEVVLYNNRSVVQGIPSIAALPANAIAKLCLKFEATAAVPGQSILVEGETGNEFFVVFSGDLEASLRISAAVADALDIERDVLFKSYHRGEFFAEYVLFSPNAATHPFNVKAVGNAELLSMSHATFVEVSEDEPSIRDQFQALAEKQHRDTCARLASRRNLTCVRRRPTKDKADKGTGSARSMFSRSPKKGHVAPDLDADAPVLDAAAAAADLDRHLERRASEVPGINASAVLKLKLWAKSTVLRVHTQGRRASFEEDAPQNVDTARDDGTGPTPSPSSTKSLREPSFRAIGQKAPGEISGKRLPAAAALNAADLLDLKNYTKNLISDLRQSLVTEIHDSEKRTRESLERLVQDKTSDAVVRAFSVERTKTMMRVH